MEKNQIWVGIIIGIVIGLIFGALLYSVGVRPSSILPVTVTQTAATHVPTATEVTWIAIGKTGYNKDLTQKGVVYKKGELYKICVETVDGGKHCSNVYAKISAYHWDDVRYLSYTTETSTCRIDKWKFLNEECMNLPGNQATATTQP